jgi:(2Fe-2S) ferredoxin
MTKIERHIFVCEHARPPQGKPSCGARGGGEILAALQEELGRHPDLWGRIAITPSGCLGLCFEGPTLVVYPEAIWYVGVRREDAREIIESHMSAGRVVERLVYRPDE